MRAGCCSCEPVLLSMRHCRIVAVPVKSHRRGIAEQHCWLSTAVRAAVNHLVDLRLRRRSTGAGRTCGCLRSGAPCQALLCIIMLHASRTSDFGCVLKRGTAHTGFWGRREVERRCTRRREEERGGVERTREEKRGGREEKPWERGRDVATVHSPLPHR